MFKLETILGTTENTGTDFLNMLACDDIIRLPNKKGVKWSVSGKMTNGRFCQIVKFTDKKTFEALSDWFRVSNAATVMPKSTIDGWLMCHFNSFTNYRLQDMLLISSVSVGTLLFIKETLSMVVLSTKSTNAVDLI